MTVDHTAQRLLAFWAIFTALGLLLVVGFASAGDIASSEVSGELGVGTGDDDDHEDEILRTLTHKETHALPHNATHDGGTTSWVEYLSTTLGLVMMLLIIGLLLIALALVVRFFIRKD